ncbi:MAG: NAD-binding protein, partial [Coleofasciculus sp. S288]|nr:NAD-binding protein [Coleofasciculus sp. S288]
GLMISEVEYADQTLTYVEPLRDVFAALFFAAIGMLIDPVFLWNNLELILGLVCLVFVGKFLIITPLVRAFGYSLKTALIVGLGLTQIGEFSFVLASEGQILGLVSRRVYLLILGTTAVTLVVTPFILRLVPIAFNWVETIPLLKQYFDPMDMPLEVSADSQKLQNHVVICGYGRVGRNLVRLLQEHHYPVLVIDQSEATIQQLREADIPYIYGNAASLHVLEKAGVDRANSMVIAMSDPMGTRLCLKRSLELNPDLDVVVRANKDRDIELLYQLGAREVVQPEFEASLELATYVLSGMGLTIWSIQKEMTQIRSSHYLALRPEQSKSQIARDLRTATEGMNSKWYDLPDYSPLQGMTLQEANIRRLTGVSLVAIRRSEGEEVAYPDSQAQLQQGDRLLAVGEPDELAAFNELAKGAVAIPGFSTPCQWLLIPNHSPAIGKTLRELHLRRQYGIQVQAIRRDGKFIGAPDGDAEIRAGDHLLLCGGSYPLNQLQEWLVPVPEKSANAVPVLTVPVSEAMQEFLPMDSQHNGDGH